jgi:hypothetical protein
LKEVYSVIRADVLVTLASWEPRFRDGTDRLIAGAKPDRVIMYYYEEYSARTEGTRVHVASLCAQEGVELKAHRLSFAEPLDSWRILDTTLEPSLLHRKLALVDITTMPRETIWAVLWLLDEGRAESRCVYHQPGEYCEEWLTRDPRRPRLVYKMGGQTKLGAQTALIVLTGYDLERTKQLRSFFEPVSTFLGIQTGEQFGNQQLNAQKHRKWAEEEPDVEVFDVDAYASDAGLAAVEAVLSKNVAERNVLMSSLGPKPSAVSLYRLHRKYPEAGLVYAPSGEFNPRYSSGIGETIYLDV